ncbi:Diphthamide biosynthesis protein 3 [Intoshia linei]|uniref:Diphthamide biosynthesis protein 3 n=1 Tax=Intoshia linei TaxID=1819745 RepID=A0A177ATD2_9BILA|nr:Diphthamide biosynthesis protein 3 [Intoshia linei]
MDSYDIFHEEIDIESMTYNKDEDIFQYPCPCGDLFEISRIDLFNGENVAECPSCSLQIKIIFNETRKNCFFDTMMQKFPSMIC